MPSVIHCRARPVRSIVALSSHGMLRYRFAALPLCRFAALPLCRFAALPLCRFAAPLRVRGRPLDASACRARTRIAGARP
ncbi:hypothetical protein [Burkholderia pseudomallei]|uniref:hypothetical protein n=1 Tax=Burkholderia pseudomallei TaxID=28450 RepID=UPI001364C2EB|nr:hypothetical protein [Burkholderia pseudomallei]